MIITSGVSNVHALDKSLQIKNLHKTFPDGLSAVVDFSVVIEEGEFVSIVGPSGSGKTTLLRLIAGLEEPTRGTIMIGNHRIDHLAPSQRDIAMLFQNCILYPHMNVFDNLAYVLKIKKYSKHEISQRVDDVLDMLGIAHLRHRLPQKLSGGERQRVALGRAIIKDASIILLDEPLSCLDTNLRAEMRMELVKLHKEIGKTFLCVTHDQMDAMSMSDKIVVMKSGEIQQIGTPLEIYYNPNSIFVAQFIGMPQINLLDCQLSCKGSDFLISNSMFACQFRCSSGIGKYLMLRQATPLILGVRPENISLFNIQQPQSFEVILCHCEMTGARHNIYLKNEKSKIMLAVSLSVSDMNAINLKKKIYASIQMDKILLFDPLTNECFYS